MSSKQTPKPETRELYDPDNPAHSHRTIINVVTKRDPETKKPLEEVKYVGDWNFSAKRKAKLLGCKPEDLTKEAFKVTFKYLTVPRVDKDGSLDHAEDQKRKELLEKLKIDCRPKR